MCMMNTTRKGFDAKRISYDMPTCLQAFALQILIAHLVHSNALYQQNMTDIKRNGDNSIPHQNIAVA